MNVVENMIRTPSHHIAICAVRKTDGGLPELEIKSGKKHETIPLDWFLGEVNRVANTDKQ